MIALDLEIRATQQRLRTKIRDLRRSRTRTAIAAFALGISLGGLLCDQPDVTPALNAFTPMSQGCGHYPRVAIRRDCSRPDPERARRLHRNPRLRCIRSIETGGRYQATSPSGTYRGAYQFSRSTWASVGPNRLDRVDPARAPRWLQDQRARRLLRIRGTQPWPPARRC